MSVIEPASRRRPGTVTAAGYLMLLTAALLVAISIVVFATAAPIVDAARKAYTAAPPKPDQVAAGLQLLFTVVAVLFLVVAVGQVLLGVFNLRGSKVARILTWILNGLAVLCFGCLGSIFLGRANPGNTSGPVNQDGVDTAKFAKALADAVPSWSGPSLGVLLAIIELCLILAILLLALPAAHPWFRKERASDVELTYPTVPAYPSVPGEPPVPSAPAAEPAPATEPQPPTATDPEPPTEPRPPADDEGKPPA